MSSKFTNFWNWLKLHWKIPFLFLSIILAWLLFRKYRKQTPIKQTKIELQAIEAAGQARAKELEVGAAQAKAWVELNYFAQLNALTQEQKEQADELRNNPAKLAAFLVRIASDK